jgi:hypothetical protein
MPAVERQVVALVDGIRGIEQRSVRAHGLQDASDQVLAALADGAFEELRRDGRQAQLAQREVEHHDEIRQRVDQRAVEVEQRGAHAAQVQAHPAASAVRIASMTPL